MKIYLLADTGTINDFDQLCFIVREALKAGVTWIQYRNKQDNQKEKFEHAKILKKICESFQAKLIINDCLETAEKLSLGVHLGQEDTSISEARKILGSQAIIGATCHNSLDFAASAQQMGASYLAFGRFFSSNTKPHAPLADTNILTAAKALFHLPIVAIG